MSTSKQGYINAHTVPPIDYFQKRDRRRAQGLDVERLAFALRGEGCLATHWAAPGCTCLETAKRIADNYLADTLGSDR